MRLGTRGSALALAQAQLVADAFGDAEIVAIKTAGGALGDKARFVREIETALLDGDVDVGVHSAKDLPAELPEGLEIAGVPAREDRADCVVGAAGSLDELADGARVGTASLRRRSQLLARRPDLEIAELRGNVDTRLARLGDGHYDAVVLAAAGLRRLGRGDEISFRLAPADMTPAAGQGALALEVRLGDADSAAAAGALTDHAALVELTAERATVAELGASCHTPVGVSARLDAETLRAEAYVGLPDGSEWIRDAVTGSPDDPAALGIELASRLAAAGAAELLARAAAEAPA